MTITSPVWLSTMFATIAFYWLLSPNLRQYFLIVATACFLLFADHRALILLATFTACTWVLLELKVKYGVILALTIPGVALAYYKVQGEADPLTTLQDVIIPLGLSYSTFRILHYVIERSRNNLPDHNFKDYLAYVFFLPTILIGPINRFPQFVDDHRTGHWRADQISRGIERILIGYFKVTVLGNFLLSNVASQWVAEAQAYSQSLGFYLEAVRGSLNLYCQFSGFSDVAIGFALMLGYRVMENFRFPFLQTNLPDFWRCWHISLTSWSREYIFMTVLSLTRNLYTATLCSLLFIGIWHEISLRYVAWGLYHGLGIVACMQWRMFKRKARLPGPKNRHLIFAVNTLKIFATANYFFLGYIITNEETLMDAARVMSMILIPWAF
jgi:D-alanyl-lipoteichoic acid acyltransferase DltB (MBOAT superfamily)